MSKIWSRMSQDFYNIYFQSLFRPLTYHSSTEKGQHRHGIETLECDMHGMRLAWLDACLKSREWQLSAHGSEPDGSPWKRQRRSNKEMDNREQYNQIQQGQEQWWHSGVHQLLSYCSADSSTISSSSANEAPIPLPPFPAMSQNCNSSLMSPHNPLCPAVGAVLVAQTNHLNHSCSNKRGFCSAFEPMYSQGRNKLA